MADFTVNGFFLILDTLDAAAYNKAAGGLNCARRAGVREGLALKDTLALDNTLVARAENMLKEACELRRALAEVIRVAQPLTAPSITAEVERRGASSKDMVEQLSALLAFDTKETAHATVITRKGKG